MKKILVLILAAAAVLTGCSNEETVKTLTANVQLTVDSMPFAKAGVTVKVTDGVYVIDLQTNEAGAVSFQAPTGIYAASVSYKDINNGTVVVYNGSVNITLSEATQTSVFTIALSVAKTSQLIIKELYTTGCDIDGTLSFSNDAYVEIYNNSDVEADASDVCFATTYPYNNNASNKYIVNEALTYENSGWVPSGSMVWGFRTTVKIPAYSSIKVALFGAIDHSATYANSVDLSSVDYAMYDTDVATHTKYSSPSANIPATNYLKAYKFSQGNAWPISNTCPSLFIFKYAQSEIQAFTEDTTTKDLTNGDKLPALKIPTERILDAVEVADINKLSLTKGRFPASINTGYVKVLSKKGHTVYRNVDKEATLAIPGNADLITYGYAGGTQTEENGSTDPSNIDAETSMKNGAKIVFKNTNNSANDFHQRAKSSLKN